MRVDMLPGPFGAAVSDIDLSQDTGDAILRELIGLLHEHQILVVRGQRLENADYCRFGHAWGKPLAFHLKSHTRNDFPEMIRISNAASTPQRYRDGAAHWHADSTYEDVPASVTMLYGVEAPEQGGETLIASAVLAYDALPQDTRARIDGLTALHCLGGSPELPGEKIPGFIEETARLGLHEHPLVMRHPVTGRKAVFTSGTAAAIKDMDRDEARALIAELRAHIVQPQFTTRYKIEVGDIFLWDNFQVLHTATPIKYSDAPGERRLLYRISTKGLPDLCQISQAA